MNRDHLSKALKVLGVSPTRYFVEGIAPEQMHDEGWYAVESSPGVWSGGYYERNLRDPFISGATEDLVVRWMLARLTDSAGDRTSGELVWGRPTVDWVLRRAAAMTASMREAGAADIAATGRLSLSPGLLCDDVDAGTLAAVSPEDGPVRRPVLVTEPVKVRATVQTTGNKAVVAFRPDGAARRSVDDLVQSGILTRVTRSPGTEERQ